MKENTPRTQRRPATAASRAAWLMLPGTELSSLTKAWRLRLNRAEMTGLPPKKSSSRVVTQADVATLVGCSPLWYGNLERGVREPGYSAEFLQSVADVLALDSHERTVLFLLALGREPAGSAAAGPNPHSASVEIIHHMVVPAWFMTPSGDVLDYNGAALRWFPHLAHENNLFRWICQSPGAKRQLVRWQADWLSSAIAQLRAANARWPDDPRLREVLGELLDTNATVRAVWDRQACVRLHPDAEVRSLFLPGGQSLARVQHVVTDLADRSQLRMVALMPHCPPPPL
ncbi:helix-turn-helix domain-containing protein [Catellatospora sp. KI3]|uniref:MmyB family transcriptional regulator n=1 Tax=Catellatospora sp. KI3 TaxID=3041620 RepID=UPI0024828CDA|nr:helix-turn-helix domain-containing protein [Catellatospora sp. KI3]MDI1461038.1 helix-turn-helix domain-containing protein [Catellatospora sp. KI3]